MKESSQVKPRRQRGSLNREAILHAAEAIVAADGFDALSMRAVAGELEAAPMALYRHVATKDELVGALLDRVLGRFEADPPGEDWHEDLGRFARSHRRLLVDHPWAVPALFANPSPGLNATRIGEHALAILRRGGLSDAHAVATFSGILALNYGWTAFARMRDVAAADVKAALAALPANDYALTKSVAAEMGDYGSDRHYEIVLGQLLAGVA
jgi:AcrR family transcriptional regulator